MGGDIGPLAHLDHFVDILVHEGFTAEEKVCLTREMPCLVDYFLEEIHVHETVVLVRTNALRAHRATQIAEAGRLNVEF